MKTHESIKLTGKSKYVVIQNNIMVVCKSLNSSVKVKVLKITAQYFLMATQYKKI